MTNRPPDEHTVETDEPSRTLLDSLDSAATWLVGSFTILATGLTAFGAVSGGLTRILRNYPTQSLLAIVFVSAGIGLGIASKTIDTRKVTAALDGDDEGEGPASDLVMASVQARTARVRPFLRRALGRDRPRQERAFTIRKWMLRIGVAFFVAGLALAVGAATQAPHNTERPHVVARLSYDNGLTLVGSVSASDLRWGEFVDVTVLAAHVTDNKPQVLHWDARRFLFVSHTGPDSDGKVDLALNVPIRNEYQWDLVQVTAVIGDERHVDGPDCSPGAGRKLGCIGLGLPLPHRPQLLATWSATGERPTLTVTTGVQGQLRPGVVETSVLANSGRGLVVLSQAIVVADSKGAANHSQVVPVDSSNRVVCVVAEELLAGSEVAGRAMSGRNCPAGGPTRTVVRLAVPSVPTMADPPANRKSQ